jgi:6-phosphofructokinase 1
MTVKNAFYAQSGGVTAVINATACGLIQEARRHPDKIGKVFAGRDGIIGALTEDLIDTSFDSDEDIARLRSTPGGAFGSCRYKLKSLDQHRAQYERLIDVFKAHDIGYFFYNGGNDSMDTAWKVSQIAEKMGYPLTCIGIPKTVDNDLPLTDCCPGFGSVAKYVATSIREAGFDVASMARTSTKIFVLEVMGRHAGWITAACGLASENTGEPPHILLFPEVPFDPERFLARVDECVKAYGYCTVAVSEGLLGADGKLMADAGGVDAFGHAQLGGVGQVVAQLIKDKLGYKYHWALADYLQRSARHLASRTDLEQAYALGSATVHMAFEAKTAVMATIERLADQPYRWTIGHAPLKDVANVERKMPANFISPDGFHITDACRTYLQPLIEGEDPPPYRNGLPDYVRLKNIGVPKKLADFIV